jgi:hypothetical protein
MWRRVDLVNWTDISEERIASIFRVEKSSSEEPAWAGSCRVYRKPIHTNLYLNAGSHHHPSSKQSVVSTLVHRARSLCDQDSLHAELVFMRDVFKQNRYNLCSSETSVQFTRSTRRHIPEDGILHSHRRENLKSYMISKMYAEIR